MGLCPHCQAPVLTVILTGIVVHAPANQFEGVSYSCTTCQSVLGVSIDPVTIKAEIVDEVVAALRRG